MRPHYHSGHESAKAKSKGFIPSAPTRFAALAKTTASKATKASLAFLRPCFCYMRLDRLKDMKFEYGEGGPYEIVSAGHIKRNGRK